MPRDYFNKVMRSPYFVMDKKGTLQCKCLRCRIESFFIRRLEGKK